MHAPSVFQRHQHQVRSDRGAAEHIDPYRVRDRVQYRAVTRAHRGLADTARADGRLRVGQVHRVRLHRNRYVEDRERLRIVEPARHHQAVLLVENPFLLQRVRDEAHRFAITYHKSRRAKAAVHSALDDIPGIGPKRRTALLRHFGSVNAIAAASPEAIQEVAMVSRTLAELILQALQKERHEDV